MLPIASAARPRALRTRTPVLPGTGAAALAVGVAGFAGFAGVPGTAAEERAELRIEVREQAGELEVSRGPRRLLLYAFAADQFKPYVKELHTLSGESLLRDAPADHLHHHGLMYAIRVNGVNFWEERDDSGRQVAAGPVEAKRGRDGEGRPWASFSQPLLWVGPAGGEAPDSPDPAARALLRERRTLTLTVDEGAGEVALEWLGEFETGPAAGKEAVLTGTDYNGLGLRLPADWDVHAVHRNSGNLPYPTEGRRDVLPGRWATVSRSGDGGATVALFGAETPPAGPSRFFSMLRPFAYLSATQGLDETPRRHAAGEKFAVRHLVSARDRPPSAEELDRRHRRWLDEGAKPGAAAAGEGEAPGAASAAEAEYRIEDVAGPEPVPLEVGGLALWPDGALLVCTRRGDLWTRREGEWSRFASGLDEPMGVAVTGPGEVVVSQRPELTRLTDSDGDGRADRFDTLADQWHYSGHIYEWTFGPVRDPRGNLFGALACWHVSDRDYDHPPYSGWQIPPAPGYRGKGRAAWRGWSFRVDAEGNFRPWSAGLRSPNGLGWNAEGDLFITDNQGEYLGSCVLHHAGEGDFHGHPNALFWGPDAVEDPFALPLEELERRRKPPAVVFPFGTMGQSASEPHLDATGGRFGPFAGQLFVGDQSKAMVMRVALEKVAGEYQGACLPFLSGFASGVNRLLFDPQGGLWAGSTDRGWGAVGGKPYALQRVVWSGRTPFEIERVRLGASGFALDFTTPVDAGTAGRAEAFEVQSFRYHYHRQYGSPEVDRRPVAVRAARVAPDGRSVSLELETLEAGKIHEIRLRSVRAADGRPPRHEVAYYTLNRLLPPESAPAARAKTAEAAAP